MPLVVNDNGTAIWTGPEWLCECDIRKKRDRQGNSIDAKSKRTAGSFGFWRLSFVRCNQIGQPCELNKI